MPVHRFSLAPGLLLCAALLSACAGSGQAVLPSWEHREARANIVDFVERVTDADGPDYIPTEDRLAVFDNDGTLLVERPAPVQFEFMYQRVRELAPEHPEWPATRPFEAVLAGDPERMHDMTFEDRRLIGNVTQAGMTDAAFAQIVGDFLAAWRHPRYEKGYADLVYGPMRELVEYLQANQFKVFIVSGGGIEFIRVYSEPAFGVRKENVIGSSRKADLRSEDGRLVVYRKTTMNSINAARFKPLNIRLHTGRRPVIAVGNSDGDLEMLRFTEGGRHASMAILLVHDDASREYAYDEEAMGARVAAESSGWQIVSMRDDFRKVFGWDSPDPDRR